MKLNKNLGTYGAMIDWNSYKIDFFFQKNIFPGSKLANEVGQFFLTVESLKTTTKILNIL